MVQNEHSFRDWAYVKFVRHSVRSRRPELSGPTDPAIPVFVQAACPQPTRVRFPDVLEKSIQCVHEAIVL